MKTFLILLALALVLYVAYSSYSFYRKIEISKVIVEKAVPFSKTGGDGPSLLVVGDSTGVGVGAENPEESVAGRLAGKIGAGYVENLSVSGAVTEDLAGQIARASRDSYDYVLVQIGGNDIIQFKSVEEAGANLDSALAQLGAKSDQIYVLSAGNVGATSLFPYVVRPFHTRLNQKYHAAFEEVASRNGATYVNLYTPPEEDPFTKEPEVYLAADGLHPSGVGYGNWFERLDSLLK